MIKYPYFYQFYQHYFPLLNTFILPQNIFHHNTNIISLSFCSLLLKSKLSSKFYSYCFQNLSQMDSFLSIWCCSSKEDISVIIHETSLMLFLLLIPSSLHAGSPTNECQLTAQFRSVLCLCRHLITHQ